MSNSKPLPPDYGPLCAGKIIPLMIDSGAFSAWTRKEVISLDEYISFLKKHIVKYPDVVYVNLDVIGNGKASYENWMAMRAAGLNPLAIYHATTDERWLKKYLHHTDHLGIGALAKMPSSSRTIILDRLWTKWLLDGHHMPTCKVHGMGISSFRHMKRYPWHSVDSTTWLKAGALGTIYIPQFRDGVWRYDMNPHKVGCSGKASKARSLRGGHIETIPPQTKKLVMDYLKFIGVPYGSKDQAGVNNNREVRIHVNLVFYAHFMQCLTWPRPFEVTVAKGLLV